MAAEIITGHTGTNHIDAGDVRALLKGLCGARNYRLENGEETTLSPATELTIPQLDILWLEDDVGQCRTDGTDVINVTATSQGYYRRDYICLQYDLAEGVESGSVVLVTGEPAGTLSNAELPTLVNTSTQKQLALYEVTTYGSEVQLIKFLLPTYGLEEEETRYFSNSTTASRVLSGDIDDQSLTVGVSLPAGAYIVCVYVNFKPAATNGRIQAGIRKYNGNQTYTQIANERQYAEKDRYNSICLSSPMVLTEQTTVYASASSSVNGQESTTSWIRALKVA